MSDQLLFVLKLCLLALLYLFFFRVLRAVWAELRTPAPTAAPAAPAAGPTAAPPGRRARKAAEKAAKAVPELVVVDPADQRGRAYPLGNEASIGRAAGCQITVDDTYVSQIHARVFTRDGQWLVEDLGSTNGTWMNRQRVSGPMVVQRGDRVQVGNTVLELR
ncbi:FHA domain-containing protein FhaB/FipA [Rhabdothermincola salaria]|uniref:FHA domain-containing protein FhaB/FipA n=1 Tax=Rhabdothermincola salaria TaxID=2903142 RepID=UPI001E596EDF|nr:FHA domain-containing protein [Rhabdothermincola salaria]